jgi:hypothetical protein
MADMICHKVYELLSILNIFQKGVVSLYVI